MTKAEILTALFHLYFESLLSDRPIFSSANELFDLTEEECEDAESYWSDLLERTE